jgi:hypothetical protein
MITANITESVKSMVKQKDAALEANFPNLSIRILQADTHSKQGFLK